MLYLAWNMTLARQRVSTHRLNKIRITTRHFGSAIQRNMLCGLILLFEKIYANTMFGSKKTMMILQAIHFWTHLCGVHSSCFQLKQLSSFESEFLFILFSFYSSRIKEIKSNSKKREKKWFTKKNISEHKMNYKTKIIMNNVETKTFVEIKF